MAQRPSRRRVTMKNVADHAGVSQTTVSFILNDVPNANIPDETRERVWTAIKELNYRPNAIARGLRAQRTQSIGFISDEVASSPHATRTIAGAQATAWAHDKVLLLVDTGRNETLKEAAVETMLERQVEGIIYATMYHRPAQPPAALREVPVVLVDCFVEDHSLPSVVPDEAQGGRTATIHLLHKGHRRIGFINTVDPIPAAAGRLEGYRQALQAFSVPFHEELLISGASEPATGYYAAQELMQRPDPPTALFCFNDHMTMGAYEGLRVLGLSIPDDVAIVGFDNHELIAAHLFPPLTTIQLPHYEMGQWAVNYLVDHSKSGEGLSPTQHRMECPLVERLST
jgi:LacI family transcriptional regulator